jgi:hypothetical protein
MAIRGKHSRAEFYKNSLLHERGASQSAMHLKAVCQGDIHVVAYRGVGARSLAKQGNPAPGILH